jgi:hypothetical protein
MRSRYGIVMNVRAFDWELKKVTNSDVKFDGIISPRRGTPASTATY